MDESSDKIEFVDQYYRMNPKTEDVLFDGTHLRDGMRVLIENVHKRGPINKRSDPSDRILQELLVENRWCTVSQVKTSEGCRFVEFVGIYDDGFKAKRREDVWEAWIVKIDSIPAIVNQIKELAPLHYEMDPKTERLLPNGSWFQNGMRVLSASLGTRVGVSYYMTSSELVGARITNRWCAVSNIKTQNSGKSFSFTATYDDGIVVNRVTHHSEGWLVKVDSIRHPLREDF